MMYVQDHDERYPADRGGPTPDYDWPIPIAPYVRNGQRFVCPSRASSWKHMRVGGQWLHYGHNCYYYRGRSQAEIEDVSGTIMIADSNGDNRIGPDYAVHEARCPGSSNCLIAPHNETLDIAFGDGHAKAMRLATIDADDSVWFDPSVLQSYPCDLPVPPKDLGSQRASRHGPVKGPSADWSVTILAASMSCALNNGIRKTRARQSPRPEDRAQPRPSRHW